MSTKAALTAQYLGTLAMLRQSVERCPADLWEESVERCPADLWEKTAGMRPRQFWRIAYHATYYTDLYLAQTEADFTDPPHYQEEATNLWAEPKDGVQPRTLTPDEVLAYIDDVMATLTTLWRGSPREWKPWTWRPLRAATTGTPASPSWSTSSSTCATWASTWGNCRSC